MTRDPADPTPPVLESAAPEATWRLGFALAAVLAPLPSDGLVLDLRGSLGSGKTLFVKGLAAGLGVSPKERVVSPTFTVARSYDLAGPVAGTLHHLDAYRLDGPTDLEAAGFETMCGSDCVTCVEWGSRVEAALPADRLVIAFAPGRTTTSRHITFRATGPAGAAVLGRWAALVAGWAEAPDPGPGALAMVETEE